MRIKDGQSVLHSTCLQYASDLDQVVCNLALEQVLPVVETTVLVVEVLFLSYSRALDKVLLVEVILEDVLDIF